MKKHVVQLLLMAVLLGSYSAYSQEIWHVEPPNWWTNMTNPELQIMIHGDQIAKYNPTIDYPGVVIQRVVSTDNPNYLFIYLTIDPNTNPGQFDIQLVSLKTGRKKLRSYELLERRLGSAERVGFDASDVMYLITPDRFANGDTGNDSVEGMADKFNRTDDFGRHGGDLKGIIDNLDYIEEMGFTALWLNPVVENDMPRGSYHGYAATDLYSIDARYGSNDDYLTLAKEAKKRGIGIIMDQIMNHCGSKHWWMDDLPAEDWVHSFDKYKYSTHKRVSLHDPYAAKSDQEYFTNGWFVETMPDMNQDNPLLGDYLIQNSIWWVEYADLKGIRHDTHPYGGLEFMKEYSCRIMNEYPNFSIVGEEWSVNPTVIAKWQAGKQNPDGYQSCMPQMFDFPLQAALKDALAEEESWGTGWIKVYEMLANDIVYANPMNLVIFPDNHDMDRVFTQVNKDYDLFKMAIVYNLTMRGIPQFYYGTELLMANEKPGNHGEIREDFPGGWPGDEVNAFTGYNLPDDKSKAQTFCKTLLNWRKGSRVIHEGKLMHYAPKNGVYVYFRYLDKKKVMVVFNKNKSEITIKSEDYREMLDAGDVGVDVLSGGKLKMEEFAVAGRGVMVVEIE